MGNQAINEVNWSVLRISIFYGDDDPYILKVKKSADSTFQYESACLHIVYVDAVSCLHIVYVDATTCLHIVQVICCLVIT